VVHADIFVQILLVTGAAFAGGIIAHSLKLPTIIGFLAAGMAIGPNTPGPTGETAEIEAVAELGVIFLMFGLGIQVSFRELISLRRLALAGGAAQVILTVLLAFVVSPLLGLDWQAGLVLAFLVAISSTVVALKFLEGRGELATIHGRAVVALCIFQDLAVVIMILVLPALGGDSIDYGGLLLALAEGAAMIGFAYVLATVVVPIVWRNIAFRRSRELSLLASLTFAVGLATGSALLGLSLAFGAFLAGVAVSESEYGFQTLSEILPLRDVFATVFFVGIGMLIEPQVIMDEPLVVAGILVLVLVGKGAITAGVTRALGISGVEALRTGVFMAQVGEFSFVLARAGIDEGLVTSELGSAFLLGSAATIVVSPFSLAANETVVSIFRRTPVLRRFMGEAAVPFGLDDRSIHRHVIVGGYGRTGRALARVLAGRRLPYVVVDSNPYLIDEARAANVPFVYGSLAQPEVLAFCNVGDARMLAVTFPGDEARVAVINARLANPQIDIIVRGSGPETHELLREVGASEVVDPEFEASLEFVRHCLHRFGVDAREITALQARRRGEHYRTEEP
jgi:CPA2 family monovalent cation:H+ antiporter-2